MGLPWESSKPRLEAGFGLQSQELGRNKAEPCPGFLNPGWQLGIWAPREGKSLWAQAGSRRPCRHSLVPAKQRGHCVQPLLGLNKNRETFC